MDDYLVRAAMKARRVSEPKRFQRATAAAAIKTLTRCDGPRRFLVADEVGLGKTVVARAIVEQLMKRRRTPLVVFYISSNLNIAHQNRAKLLELLPTEEEQDEAAALVDRLTLAANRVNRPTHKHLHLYTLTPDTSVPLYRRRGGFGRLEERALIFRLLSRRFPSLRTAQFSNLCRGSMASEASWSRAVQLYEVIDDIRTLQDAYLESLASDEQLKLPCVDAESLLTAARRERPSRLMGSLRTSLAIAVLKEVKPDLIIFDEFQRFRNLLIDPSCATPDPVTRALRGGCRRNDPALLLLSATPYRPYSSRQDEAAGLSHHQDFFQLIRFLFGSDPKEPAEIERAFNDFGAQMLSIETPDLDRLAALRDNLEERLRPVMSRTERPNQIGTLSTDNHPRSELLPEDLQVFKHWVARLQQAEGQQLGKGLSGYSVPFWLSVPLPIQMLGQGYVAWKRAQKKRRPRDEPRLRCSQRDRLESPKVWPHPQLRVLSQKIAAPSRLALPWVAPSLPWWDLQGPWSKPGASGGKLLIFSRFKAVPPALASLLSFELEASFSHRLGSYHRAGKTKPLQFKADRPGLPAVFFPSPTLIAFTDPRRDKPVGLEEVRKSMHQQVIELCNGLGVRVQRSSRRRPLWKLLAALESVREKSRPDCDLPSWTELRRHWRHAAGDQEEAMKEVLQKWHRVAEAGLGCVTSREVVALAEFALSGPGIVLGRALYRFNSDSIKNNQFESLLAASWNGLRPYLNRCLFQAVLTRRNQAYTEAILEAVVAGNLESVLDEHLWIASSLNADAIARFPRDLHKVLGLVEGRHRVHEPGTRQEGFFLRCHAAMPFANAKVENTLTGSSDRLRTDDLRQSFNTPFWPHVLATTSVGQEGLDFHVWCKQLLHWDLCPSPLGLEQREGRIQRFGGLSVRCALAEDLRQQALGVDAKSEGPWTILAKRAESKYGSDASGRSPWWSCPGEKIDRLFVVLPNSRQTNRFDQLSRQRWVYRLALGQTHQQDFIESVSQLPDDGRQQFALRLSAWQDDVD